MRVGTPSLDHSRAHLTTTAVKAPMSASLNRVFMGASVRAAPGLPHRPMLCRAMGRLRHCRAGEGFPARDTTKYRVSSWGFRMPGRSALFFVVSIPLALLCGCQKNYGHTLAKPDENPGLPAAISVAPEVTSDGWHTSTPGEQGMDEKPLLELMQHIRDGAFADVDSVVIAKNDALIAEGYFHGFGRDTPHD